MKDTIDVMKKTGLFQSLACNMFNDDNFGIQQVADSIELVCHIDEKFADTFGDDADDLAVKEIYKALQEEVKMMSLNKVDPDALYAQATGQDDEDDEPTLGGVSGLFKNTYGARVAQAQDEMNKKVEETMLNAINEGIKESIKNIFGDWLNDCKQ